MPHPPTDLPQRPPELPRDLNAAALARDLRRSLRGEVRFDAGSRALYATDGSNYRQVPIGVVLPRDEEDAVAALALCREHGAPVLGRGCGTSLAGQCCNVAVVFDFSRYMRGVVSLDPGRRRAVVQPGIVLDHLRRAAERHGLTFGPDPATHDRCTLGGMIGNNSCGVHSIMSGQTAANVEEMEIVTYDGARMTVGPASDSELEAIVRAGGRRGEIYRGLRVLRDRYADLIRARFPRIPRRVSGYNLDELLPENGFQVARALVGTEGTCVMVLNATLKLISSPPARSLLVLGYPSVYEAADHVMEILAAGCIGLEGFDDTLIGYMRRKGLHPEGVALLPPGGGWLLVEFGGESKQESDGKAGALMTALARQPNAPSMKLFHDRAQELQVWAVRESGLGATAFVPGLPVMWEGWEDAAVAPEKLGSYLRQFRDLLQRYGYSGALYGHFGDGCVHTRIDFDFGSEHGVRHYRRFVDDAADLVLAHGGSLSGEHGDGQSRAELLPKMFGPELVRAFQEFKALWDPLNRMNPGKVVHPYRLDENLRVGPGFHPAQPETRFRFPDDQGQFARATLRCVGVGKCRRTDGGTMCPSYMATGEEMHSTRGRAHLLFEMLQGEVVTGGWRDGSVKEALDLCLSCKGCKGDCPVNVDVATYKAEFLSHYYEGRLRPARAYAYGLVDRWARVASLAPGMANLLTQTPVLAALAKLVLGMAPQRRIPALAPCTFKQWFRRHPLPSGGAPVVLFGDTFNNHFLPHTAEAAVEVLEAAGFRPQVPMQPLCCGRPLYDFGMLDRAKIYLQQVMTALRPRIEAGIPIVVLEPSCASVFRDELRNLFPGNELAVRLSQSVFLLSEFLERHAPGFAPQLPRQAVVHGHCHHKSILRFDDEARVLRRIGIDANVLDSGCCGMAGPFGFEAEKYDVSMACGERVLLPEVRRADPAALIVADGFSCREQIAQATNRRALHLAEVLQMALHGDVAAAGPFPESRLVADFERGVLRSKASAAALLAGGALAAAALFWILQRK
jgi:FAD/FMN-containing dehydrogenase/Fe-S oxidoreductase